MYQEGRKIFTWYWGTKNESIALEAINTSTSGYMIHNQTLSVLTTRSRTRICTLIPNTSLILRTVVIQHTFWSASPIRISLVFWKTTTCTMITNRVWTTWWRIARILNNRFRIFYFNLARSERISYVSFETSTCWRMVDNVALSVQSAGAWARISAFVSNTSLITGALCVYGTFRSTIWRSANKAWKTRTRWVSPDISTLTVRTTWWRLTWIQNRFWHRWWR